MTSPDSLRNRETWDGRSDDYQARNAEFIGRKDEPRWGMWQLPESELQILGDVAGKDVLELGCGAAQWSILLAGRGARVVGLDNSARQLEHARRSMQRRVSTSRSSMRAPMRCRCLTRASRSSSATTER
jgi:SAM-dependent methyltransferase